jgi:hypothetical protein
VKILGFCAIFFLIELNFFSFIYILNHKCIIYIFCNHIFFL